METPPFKTLLEIRAERQALAARDAELEKLEGAELQQLSRFYSDAQIGHEIGLTPQRVGQLRRRSRALADTRTHADALIDGLFGKRRARSFRSGWDDKWDTHSKVAFSLAGIEDDNESG